MSYILEALKKSEKERQRGTVPDLLTVQDVMELGAKKRSLWPYLLIMALLLNAGILVWWLSPWQSKKSKVVAQSTAGQQRESKAFESVHEVSDVRLPVPVAVPPPGQAKTINPGARVVVEDSAPKLETTTAKPDENPVNVAQQNQIVEAKADLRRKVPSIPPQVDTRGSREVFPSEPQQTPAISHVPSGPEPVDNTVAAVENRLYNLKDLPVSIQQSLPVFTISVLLYSHDPTSRMVKINDQMMREGQYLTAGLKLEEITRNGVIFDYKNYRFHVGMRDR